MLTVTDIMQREVLTVAPTTTVRELTRLLSEQGISGAPVVDASGAVLGVVSATDVVRLAAEEAEVPLSGLRRMGSSRNAEWRVPPATGEDEEENDSGLGGYFLPEDGPGDWGWEDRAEDPALDEFTVADIMTPVSFTIGPDASVRELADFLVRGRIHRAIVSDGMHLVGIVTTMDVLRAVAREEG